MNLRYYIFPFALTVILGCASEPSKIDVKGDSVNMLRDTTAANKNSNDILDENEFAEENEMWKIMEDYGPYIRKYSKRYGFDWRLILAIIKKESRFSFQAESHRGALGLMQIMPETRRSLAEEMNLEEVVSPRNNIAAGIYYLWKLEDSFDYADEENKLKLCLGAYNCGLGRINDARDIVRAQGGDPNDWDTVSEALKLLSKEHSDLHKKVWDLNKPSSGYFSDFEQPIEYVNVVLKYYNNFKLKFASN